MMFSLICVVRFREKITRIQFLNSILYIFVLVMGIFVRLLFGHQLIMSIYGSLAILLAFMAYEHPALYIEGISGCFSERSMVMTFDE